MTETLSTFNPSTVRSRAKRLGYSIKKSRERNLHLNNRGHYMLIDVGLNSIRLGPDFDATIEDIWDYLNDRHGN